MDDDGARRVKMETLEQWAEMKTRRAVLDAIFDKWRDLFTRAVIQLESKSGQSPADLKSLPAGPEVDAAMAEYRMLTDGLIKMRAALTNLGLKVE